MAGRTNRLAIRATALGVAALAAGAGLAPATGAAGSGGIVVSQTDTNASIGFGHRSDVDHVQKLAQTFVAPKGAHKLASLSLLLAGKGNAVVKIYEVGKRPPFGTRLRKIVLPVDQYWGDPGTAPQRARIRPALVVEPGQRYSLVLTTQRRRKSLIAAGGIAGYRRGAYWCFCPQWKDGAVDVEGAHWQSAEELDSPLMDLTFELGFWRKG